MTKEIWSKIIKLYETGSSNKEIFKKLKNDGVKPKQIYRTIKKSIELVKIYLEIEAGPSNRILLLRLHRGSLRVGFELELLILLLRTSGFLQTQIWIQWIIISVLM